MTAERSKLTYFEMARGVIGGGSFANWPTDSVERMEKAYEFMDKLRAEIAADAGALDEAWAATETALPKGWVLEMGNFVDGRGWAQAIGPEVAGRHPSYYDRGSTPAAALLALAQKLRESRP